MQFTPVTKALRGRLCSINIFQIALVFPFPIFINVKVNSVAHNVLRLQDISSGYWVLVLHFTRKEAVRQIDELQHIATNLGRSEIPANAIYTQLHVYT